MYINEYIKINKMHKDAVFCKEIAFLPFSEVHEIPVLEIHILPL